MALNNKRLFVAALGNNTVEVLDIKGAKRWAARATGCALRAYVRIGFCCAKDGTCRIYDASSFQLLQTVEYSEDRLMRPTPRRFRTLFTSFCRVRCFCAAPTAATCQNPVERGSADWVCQPRQEIT